MNQVFLGIGGNIGNKHDNFDKVYTFIKNELGAVTKSSSVYETSPWGFQAEDNFWNQVLIVETKFSAVELLQKINNIETRFGRKRDGRQYKSREMDIDILYFDKLVVKNETLVIPHQHLQKRLFVLVPLAEIAPDFIHPVLKLTSVEMLNVCEDKSVIKKLEL
jgi:2-amino-4-hydroxy-6-hydroxymethyldihydropteridine diphosphokinase